MSNNVTLTETKPVKALVHRVLPFYIDNFQMEGVQFRANTLLPPMTQIVVFSLSFPSFKGKNFVLQNALL